MRVVREMKDEIILAFEGQRLLDAQFALLREDQGINGSFAYLTATTMYG